MPKVSVIIPTYNYGRFLGEAIQSVLDQTFADFDLIVVDDGSTDKTREVVAGFKDDRIRYIYQENRGVSAAQNVGILASKGEYVALLGADDVWLPEKLELQVNVLDSRPEVAAVCSDIYILDDQTGAITGRFWHNSRLLGPFNPQKAARKPLRRLLSRGCFIHNCTAMVRRDVFTEVGLYDESLKTLEVWVMWVRVLLSFVVEIIDIPLGKYRRHGNNLTVDWEQMFEDGITVLNKAMRTLPLESGDLRILKRRLARQHYSYGRALVANGRIVPGREKLIESIKGNPRSIKPYIFLAVSSLGSRLILRGKSWKKRLVHRFAWGRS
jgi:glycosyltransferase involved in cell wall biosynthesis